MPKPPGKTRSFDALCEIVATLRGEKGCPWDRKQTHQSLARFAIEEVFELVEAIEELSTTGDTGAQNLKDELGDVLFQVILHSEMAKEKGWFDILDVIENLNEKMIRRHPHVFSDLTVQDAEEVVQNWEKIKAQEKASQLPPSLLATPKGLPALMEAYKIGNKTKKLKFDWVGANQVFEKVLEEVEELKQELNTENKSKESQLAEVGDVLFSVVQLARHLDIDPEEALRKTNARFRKRFEGMMDQLNGDVDQFVNLSEEEKENLWQKVKRSLITLNDESS